MATEKQQEFRRESHGSAAHRPLGVAKLPERRECPFDAPDSAVLDDCERLVDPALLVQRQRVERRIHGAAGRQLPGPAGEVEGRAAIAEISEVHPAEPDDEFEENSSSIAL
jgi:hypothetical protein